MRCLGFSTENVSHTSDLKSAEFLSLKDFFCFAGWMQITGFCRLLLLVCSVLVPCYERNLYLMINVVAFLYLSILVIFNLISLSFKTILWNLTDHLTSFPIILRVMITGEVAVILTLFCCCLLLWYSLFPLSVSLFIFEFLLWHFWLFFYLSLLFFLVLL